MEIIGMVCRRDFRRLKAPVGCAPGEKFRYDRPVQAVYMDKREAWTMTMTIIWTGMVLISVLCGLHAFYCQFRKL